MMLRRSVERLAAPARLRGRRVRMPRNGLSSPRAGSRGALPVSGAPHVITRCVVSDARAEQPLLTVVGIHVGHTNAAVREYHRDIDAIPPGICTEATLPRSGQRLRERDGQPI
jgi:hypothetical protein